VLAFCAKQHAVGVQNVVKGGINDLSDMDKRQFFRFKTRFERLCDVKHMKTFRKLLPGSSKKNF
jgi:hypothetical protein